MAGVLACRRKGRLPALWQASRICCVVLDEEVN